MKRWHKRSVIILLLGIAGIIALGLRPSVEPPTARALTAKPYAEIPLPAHYVTGDLRITYRWQLTEPPRHTVLRSSLQKNVFDMVTPTEWEIIIQAKDGKLTAEYTTPTLPAKKNHPHHQHPIPRLLWYPGTILFTQRHICAQILPVLALPEYPYTVLLANAAVYIGLTNTLHRCSARHSGLGYTTRYPRERILPHCTKWTHTQFTCQILRDGARTSRTTAAVRFC